MIPYSIKIIKQHVPVLRSARYYLQASLFIGRVGEDEPRLEPLTCRSQLDLLSVSQAYDRGVFVRIITCW